MFVGCKIIIKSKYGMWKGRNTSLLQFFLLLFVLVGLLRFLFFFFLAFSAINARNQMYIK